MHTGITSRTIYTIGHSNRPIEDFTSMLRAYDIKVLADIRSMPGSKLWPQYNLSALSRALQQAGIKYMHLPDLGGKRKAPAGAENTGAPFGGYSAYMQTSPFAQAIEQLEAVAEKEALVYMCAEALWSHCHRSMVSDHLKVRGWRVLHIMDKDKITEHPGPLPAKPEQGKLF